VKNYKLSWGVIYMTTSSLSKRLTESDAVLIKDSNKKTFNFNPQEVEVGSFLSSILLEMLGADKLAELRGKQEKLDSLLKKIDGVDSDAEKRLKNNIAELKSELILAAAEKINEKVTFTFTGFDISKQPIPSELVNKSESILDARVLTSLAKAYLNTQIYSVFNITENEFGNLSKKAPRTRTPNEVRKYNKVLTLLPEVLKIQKLSKNPDTTNEELTTALEKIKALGKKGTKLYNLLKPIVDLSSKDATSTEKNHLLGIIRNFITLFREVLEEILSPAHNFITGTRSVSFVNTSSTNPPREIYRSIPELSFANNSTNFFKKAPERSTLPDEKTENNSQSVAQTEEKEPGRYLCARL